MKLTSKGDWKSRWESERGNLSQLNPRLPSFRQRHSVLRSFLDGREIRNCLEVGAYPGTYLRYFYEYYGVEPWGVEYVESCADSTRETLNAEGIRANIISKDFFKLSADESPGRQGWDLTFSFGFVEHFDDSLDAVAQHISVTKPGGLIVISIPNHSGINGPIMRFADKRKWQQHNLMSLSDLENCVTRAGGADVLYSGYVGSLGLWNASVYSRLKAKYRWLYPIVRAPLWLVEWIGQWLVPNNRLTSPDALMILCKRV